MSSNFFTKVVHAGSQIDPMTGAVMPPIYQTSTYAQQSPGVHKGYDYSRADNPTRELYEKALAELESANHGLAFSSGLAAVQAVVQLLEPGDEVIVCDDVYGGTGRLFRKLFAKYGLVFHFIDMNDDALVKQHLNAKTRMIWLETPTNPTMKVIDIARMVSIAKGKAIKVVVDNTFATPFNQNPLDLGADICLHSTTKYLGGHTDVIGGALMVKDQQLFKDLKFIQFAGGAVPGPFECYLLLRSLRTLAVRMDRHNKNGLEVAHYLTKHSRVRQVYYPGLPSDPGHEIAKKQMRGYSGIVSFDIAGDFGNADLFLQSLKLFVLAESLGGVESLVNHPERMTHASVPEPLRKKLGIGPTLIRLSVGIEDASDIIADLEQAFKKAFS
jgi:cystathionine beta-lyase